MPRRALETLVDDHLPMAKPRHAAETTHLAVIFLLMGLILAVLVSAALLRAQLGI